MVLQGLHSKRTKDRAVMATIVMTLKVMLKKVWKRLFRNVRGLKKIIRDKKKSKISPWQKTFQKMFPTKRFPTSLLTLLKLRRVKLLVPLDHLNQSLEKHHPALQSLFRSLPPFQPNPLSACFLPESRAPGMIVVQPAYPLTLISRNPSPELCKTDSWHLLTHRP